MKNRIGILRRFSSKWMLISTILAFFGLTMHANVTIPYILSDNMVLQRDVPVNIWGWANAGEKVTVTFNGQKVSTKTGKTGEWKVQLKPLQAGGPFELTIKGKNQLVLKNILVGDVWVCSGQSNMEFALAGSKNWAIDKEKVENANIRLFYVPKNMSMKPLDNTLESQWQICSQEAVAGFSAVGYYFGRNIQREINIPIGLINTNWGGTDIETWTSLETMYADNDYKPMIDKIKTMDLEKLKQDAELKIKKWQHVVNNEDPGIVNRWYAADANVSDWQTMRLPQAWEGAGLPALDGVVWFRKEITISAENASGDALLSLGPIDDSDETYVNGVKVGRTENRYDAPRLYKIPSGTLKAGVNIISIKVIDTGGGGGLWGMDNQIYLQTTSAKIDLAGNWLYKMALNLEAPKDATSPNSYPSLLYNGMIHPIIKFPIKGVIWYQGENNAGNFIKYRTLFPAMIKDWRAKWNVGDFGFYFVQLANYMEPPAYPQQSTWAGLREAQTMALSLPNTGMAVIIDIGEAKDIHPKNKHDVGYRLSLAALKTTYGKDIVYSGPMYKSMQTEGNKIILEFDQVGSGLVVKDKYGYLKSFAIAGADKKFVWAKAWAIPGNKVVVSSDAVSNPVAVRYAWSDNPDDANLYNVEGLPACPFRTDNW